MDERDVIIAEYEQLLRNWKARCRNLEMQLERERNELVQALERAARWEECAKLGHPEIITQWMEATYGTDTR